MSLWLLHNFSQMFCGLSCSTSTVLQHVKSVVAPEVVGISTVGAGSKLGGCTTTTWAIDGFMKDCGVLSGVPGGFDEVWCSTWGSSNDCGIFGLCMTIFRIGIDVCTDSGESKVVSGTLVCRPLKWLSSFCIELHLFGRMVLQLLILRLKNVLHQSFLYQRVEMFWSCSRFHGYCHFIMRILSTYETPASLIKIDG